MQRRQARTRCHRKHEADRSDDPVAAVQGTRRLPKHQEPRKQHQHGEEIRGEAKKQESDVGEPGAPGTHEVEDRFVRAGTAERGILRPVSHERDEQDQAESRQAPECRFAQNAQTRNAQGHYICVYLGHIHVIQEKSCLRY